MAALVFGALLFCSACHKDDIWDVVTIGLPDRVVPARALINIGRYILKQSHEPLFRNDTDGRLYSRLLKSWERNQDYSSFQLCVKENLFFSERSPFGGNELRAYLVNVIEKAKLGGKVRAEGVCSIVLFPRPTRQFLRLLGDLEHAPSIPSGNPLYELGLGPFKVVRADSKEIFLERKDKVKSGFNFVRFRNFEGANDPKLEDRTIEDFNRVYVEYVPKWVMSSYRAFRVPMLQSYDLIINYKDEAVRQAVYHCLNVDEVRRAFLPQRKAFLDIGTIFPVGLPGAISGRPKQVCKPEKWRTKDGREVILKFANWKPGTSEQFKKLFDVFQKKTGIRIEIVDTSVNAFLESILRVPHPHDLFIVALDGTVAEPLVFAENFIRKDVKAIDFDLKETAQAAAMWGQDLDESVSAELARKVVLALRDRAVVLPLFQNIWEFYYPRGITGFDFSRDLLQYPEVAELRR